ncbi:MAG: isopeptide-forming domain-containing fimbrial protein [Ruminococcus sp.]|nr:isopeptide-forming domain-containing fimbrial protein [Ruminococcus sp.]
MKNTKKFAAMIAALTLSACSIAPMAMTASAATATTITVPEGEHYGVEHEYKIYQIFTGTYKAATEDSGATLEGLTWGNGVSGKSGAVDPTDAIYKILTEGEGTDRANIKAFIAELTLNDANATTVTSSNGTATVEGGLADGYYYIVDTTNLANGSGTVEGSDGNGNEVYDAKSAIMVQIIGGETAEITVKKSRPSVEKKIEDNEAATVDGYDGIGFNESADHAINETFQFKLTATIPADADLKAYDYYYLNFKDTFSEGVTFEKIDKITIGSDVVIDTTDEDTSNDTSTLWTIPTDAKDVNDTRTFNVTTNDIKAQIGADKWGVEAVTIEVLYSAHLNENAEVFKEGTDENGTADTNENKVSLEYSSNPENSGDGKGKPEETKETPEDYVWAFTYGVDDTKVDATDNNTKLPGAVFQLKKGDAVVKLQWNATKKAYVVADQDATVAEGDSLENPSMTGVTNYLVSNDSTVDTEKGTFNIIGLDAGNYTLVEVKAPTGYALPTGGNENTAFKVDANHKEVTGGTAAVLTFNNDENAAPANTVENSFSSSLPSTGGIGTTIFYLGGGAMVAVAGVFLITKKRMGKSEN